MGPRNGVPATHSASQTRVNALLLSRGAPRGDDPSRIRWVRFAKMHGSPLSCPLPLRERAQWSAHKLERVRGSRNTPLTHHRTWQHRAALSREGRGHNNCDRAYGPIHFSNSQSRSRDALASEACDFCFAHPERGWAERRETFGCSAEHPCGVRSARHKTRVNALMTRHARRLARRLASHDAGRSPLGAPPWRFWAPGAALLSPAFAPDRLQRAPRTQVVVPGGRGPEPPGANGYKPPPQDATPRSVFRSLPEDALNERGWDSAFTRVHSPSKTGVNALRDALWRGGGGGPRKGGGGGGGAAGAPATGALPRGGGAPPTVGGGAPARRGA